jgi:hypothetical protein
MIEQCCFMISGDSKFKRFSLDNKTKIVHKITYSQKIKNLLFIFEKTCDRSIKTNLLSDALISDSIILLCGNCRIHRYVAHHKKLLLPCIPFGRNFFSL